MRISEKPTKHILVKAYIDSEWDCCDYAIITCGDGWAERIKRRLEACRPLCDDERYFSSKYFDGSASFYVSSDEETELLPADRDWAYVELEEGEPAKFSVPENRQECHTVVLYKDGGGRYQAFGKHTGEVFYTADLPFDEIVASL